MPNYISKVELPSGGTYEIKDIGARDLISRLTTIQFIIAWDGTSAPTVANIPAGVVVTYNGTSYTGTLAALSAQQGAFYLVKSQAQSAAPDVYDEYVVVVSGSSYSWEKIGDTQIDLSDVVTDVSLSKQTDVVLGEATSFTASTSTAEFAHSTTDVVLGEGTTFSASGTAVTPSTTYLGATASGTAVEKTTKYLSATASGTAVGANGTASAVTGYPNVTSDDFLTGVSTTKKKLATTTVPNVTGNTDVSIPNVTGVGSASTWSFTMGTGDDAETLIIAGANSTTPTLGSALSASKVTLGTAKTVATGSLTDGTDIVTGVTATDASALTALGTPTTATALTGVQITSQPSITLTSNSSSATGRVTYIESLGSVTQPTITLASNSSSATGRVQVATGISSVTQPTITVGTDDKVTAITGLGVGHVSAPTITVGTNDKVTVLKSTTDVSVTKGV